MQITKTITPAQVTVGITKSVTPTTGEAPTTFMYSVTLDPSGGTATNVTLTDKLPAGLSSVKLLNYQSECCWKLGGLEGLMLMQEMQAHRDAMPHPQSQSAARVGNIIPPVCNNGTCFRCCTQLPVC